MCGYYLETIATITLKKDEEEKFDELYNFAEQNELEITYYSNDDFQILIILIKVPTNKDYMKLDRYLYDNFLDSYSYISTGTPPYD